MKFLYIIFFIYSIIYKYFAFAKCYPVYIYIDFKKEL